jgi:RNase P subunit RPR2
MHCQRCRGLLVHETFDELTFETGRLRTVTRCINCGCIEDAVVRANRVRRPERIRSTPRRRRVTRKYDVVFGTSDT